MNLMTRYTATNKGWCPYNTGRRCLADKCLGWLWATSEEAAENLSLCKDAAGAACRSKTVSDARARLGRCALITAWAARLGRYLSIEETGRSRHGEQLWRVHECSAA